MASRFGSKTSKSDDYKPATGQEVNLTGMTTPSSTSPKLSHRGFTTGLLSATVLSSPVLTTAHVTTKRESKPYIISPPVLTFPQKEKLE